MLPNNFFPSLRSNPELVLLFAPIDALTYIVSWVGIMRFAYAVAPPDLIGTMAAAVNVSLWTIGDN